MLAYVLLFPKSQIFGSATEKPMKIQRKANVIPHLNFPEIANGNPTKSKQFFGNATIGKTKIGNAKIGNSKVLRCNPKENVKVPRKANGFNRKAKVF